MHDRSVPLALVSCVLLAAAPEAWGVDLVPLVRTHTEREARIYVSGAGGPDVTKSSHFVAPGEKRRVSRKQEDVDLELDEATRAASIQARAFIDTEGVVAFVTRSAVTKASTSGTVTGWFTITMNFDVPSIGADTTPVIAVIQDFTSIVAGNISAVFSCLELKLAGEEQRLACDDRERAVGVFLPAGTSVELPLEMTTTMTFPKLAEGESAELDLSFKVRLYRADRSLTASEHAMLHRVFALPQLGRAGDVNDDRIVGLLDIALLRRLQAGLPIGE